MIRDYLLGFGYVVAAAHTGPAGAERATAGGPWQAVILDVMLPGLDGFEVLKGIRRTSAVPVLMLTARGDEADISVRRPGGPPPDDSRSGDDPGVPPETGGGPGAGPGASSSGPPPPLEPLTAGPLPKFMLATDASRRYWAGVNLGLVQRPTRGGPPPGLSLLLVSGSLRGGGLFFDYAPSLLIGGGLTLLSLLLWLPLVHGLTQALARMRVLPSPCTALAFTSPPYGLAVMPAPPGWKLPSRLPSALSRATALRLAPRKVVNPPPTSTWPLGWSARA